MLTLSLNTFDPIFIEIAAQIGIDIIWIEMEHASITLREAENLCRITQGSGMLSLIRLPNSQREMVLKAAETGTDMLMAPMIETTVDLKQLVKFAKYAPIGERGFYSSSRALNYGLGSTIAELRSVANDRLMLWGQIETLPALDRLDDLCQVAGIDGIFIGSGDLSSAYGVPGEVSDPRVVNAVDLGLATSRQYNKSCASVMPSTDIQNWKQSPLDMVVVGGNVGFLVTAAKLLQEKLQLQPAFPNDGMPRLTTAIEDPIGHTPFPKPHQRPTNITPSIPSPLLYPEHEDQQS